mmetsp:Transcript_55105/g.129353  ORF Transcript_55105/g.129353 Transcript_55105/m.129353 type:complete len:187 (-) Transcript_55105:201-761(-)
MPILHRLLTSSTGSDEEVERLREAFNNIFTTIGVVAALLLTMDQTGESIDDDASDWIDCGEVPCNDVHVVLAWLSLSACAHAVMYTTCAMVWLSVVPVSATRDFFHRLPNIMLLPGLSMILGCTCWALDALWLTTIRHGANLKWLWLAIPAMVVFLHVISTCLQMRHFAWNCKLDEVKNDTATISS